MLNTYCSTDVIEADKVCDIMESSDLADTLLSQCAGKNSCLIENLQQFVNVPSDHDGTGCFHEDALMFIQVGCTMPDEQLASRRKHALVLGSVGAFIALFAINYIDFVKKKEENAFVAFDVKTITAGDYTIEFDLDETFYADYLKK